MIPPSFDYHAPTTLAEALALLGQLRRRRQGALGRAEPAAAAQAALRPARRTSSTSAASPASSTSRRRAASCGSARRRARWRSRLRRSCASKYPILADTAAVIADPHRAQPGDGGRQPGPRRPGQRPPGDHAGAGRRGGGDRPQGRAHDPDRALLHRPLHDRARARTRSSPRSASRRRRPAAAAPT